MKDLNGRVAVITGGGSGFGRELAILCAAEGMKIVLADIDEAGMQGTEALLAPGTEVISRRCDVSSADSVEALAVATYERFGACHLLFNNAGVGTTGPAWTATLHDWAWTFGINVMGVAHGIKSFVPRMIAAGGPGHVVNTASAAGLMASPGSAVYCASKSAVVGLTECMYHELRAENAPVGVSLLCPAFVNTGILNSERSRPAELQDANPLAEKYAEKLRKAILSGKLTATDVAVATMDAVKEDRFYILPHRRIKQALEVRFGDILNDRSPTNLAG